MARYPQAVLVSCEIPWDENEHLIEDLLREEVRHTLKAGFNHLYIFGTAGEGHAVDTGRYRQIVQIFYEETRGPDIHPMVGAIGLSTANIVERVGFAHDIGFRTFQTVLPSWGALNDDELLTFFKDLCGTFPDSRFLTLQPAARETGLGWCGLSTIDRCRAQPRGNKNDERRLARCSRPDALLVGASTLLRRMEFSTRLYVRGVFTTRLIWSYDASQNMGVFRGGTHPSSRKTFSIAARFSQGVHGHT